MRSAGLGICVALLVSAMASVADPPTTDIADVGAPAEHQEYIVLATNEKIAEVVGERLARQSDNHGAFSVVFLSPDAAERIRASGIAAYPAPPPVLTIGNLGFDPMSSDGAETYARLEAEGLNQRVQGIFPILVQVREPVAKGQESALEEAGVFVTPHYVRGGGYVVLGDEVDATRLVSVPGVRWIGEYLPAFKSAAARDLPSTGTATLVVSTFPGTGGAQELASLARSWGGDVLQTYEDPWFDSYATVSVDATRIGEIARQPWVDTIEPYLPARPGPTIFEKSGNGIVPNNAIASWVIQSFQSGQTPIWAKGLHGEGVVVACGDTGIDYDHTNFRDTQGAAGTPGPSHRKVVKLTNFANTREEPSLPHGSHVMGSIAGKAISDPQNYVSNDGQAYHAKLAVMDIFDLDSTQNEIMPPMAEYFQDGYDAGARTSSNSWGGYLNQSQGVYSWRSYGADAYQWSHPDFLAIFAAGNDGPGSGTASEPGTGKNVLTIGAAQNGNTKALASFSSNGPTSDGVRKPDIVTPGQGIQSVAGDSTIGNMNSGFQPMSGTSMATPTASGGLALIQQYLHEGWYPGGTKGSGAPKTPSGPLMKAMAINSGWDQFTASNVDANIPDNSQGWGKMKLEDVLYFTGDARKLWLDDAAFTGGLNTGDKVGYIADISGAEALEVTLVWNDAPGNGLIQDLDLLVTAPDGSKYLGSVFQGGASVTGGTADNKNAVEGVLLKTPAAGKWNVEIIGKNLPKAPQPYSLVITGGVNNVTKGGASAPTVVQTSPLNQATNVPTTASVSVTFDRAMNKTSVETALSSSPALPGTFNWSAGDTKITLAPTAPMTKGTLHTITAAKTATDTAGIAMANDHVFGFTTEVAAKPAVVRTEPADGELGVDFNAYISAVFTLDMDRASVEAAISVAPAITGAYSWPVANTVIFTPSAPLAETTKYTVTVGKDAKDLQGTPLGVDTVFSFTTRQKPDAVPPTVQIIEPASGATLTGSTVVKVAATDDRGIFNVELFVDGATFGSLTAAPYEWPWDTARWPNGGKSLEARARDTSGNTAKAVAQVTLDNDVDPPRVTGVNPGDQSKDVAASTPVVITFSEPVDHPSAEGAFSLTPAEAGGFTWSGNAMTFKPGAALAAGISYTVKVRTSVKDNAGNLMSEEFIATFTTSTPGGGGGGGGGGGAGGSAFPLPMLLVIILAVVAVVAVAAGLMMRKKKKQPDAVPSLQWQPAQQGYPCPSCGGYVAPGAPSCQNCGAYLAPQAPAWGPPGNG